MKQKIGRKLLSFMLTLAMVFGTFTGIVPGTEITAKADTSDTGVEVLIADIDDRNYKDKTTSFTTDDGLANISFSTTPTFDDEYGWYNPNGELTITVTAANEDYPISKCVFQCYGEGREDSIAPFEVTISHGGNWQNTTATINGVTESSGGLRNIGFFSLVTPDYTALKDGMLIKPGESIIPGDYYYKTAEHVNTYDPEYRADFKKNTLYTLVKGNIESRQVDPSYNPDWYEDVFVESNNGDHYAFLQVADGKYIFDGSWEVTNHADGLLVSQGTSESMSNPEERITTYAFSVHEKVFNDVTVDSTIENGNIEIKDSEGTAISEAEAESTVTLEVSPAAGYKLDKISANYLEVQSVSQLMELIGNEKCYEYPSNTTESNYFEVVDNSIKVYAWMQGDYWCSLPSTVELNKTRSSEGIYTAIGTYNGDPLTWIFKVKKGKIISIGFESNGVDWGIVNIESTGAIAEPTYASVDLTTVTEGEKYTFTMPATDVTVNAVFEEDSAQNTWTSGDCTVTYDSDTKTMTVTGNGAMGSYESEDQVPWKDIIEESVEKIVIDEGVTSIGENVFYHCDSVKEIYISSTVRNIKNQAFFNYSMYSSNVYFTRPSVDCELQIDGMPFNLDYWTLNYSGDGKYVLYDKNIDLENASSVTKLIGNWEADGAGGSIYTTKIFTWKIPTSNITCFSEHGVVTASVGGTDVTTAEVGDEVTLKVKPDLGYQLKSITATFPKDGVETFDDLVGLMGDAVINGDTKFNQFGEYTCKVENGQFAIYNGNDLVSRTSDITDFEVRDNGHTIIFNSGNLGWSFGLDRDTGNIIVISVSYISDWNSAFVSADNSESTGTIPPNEISLTTVKEGSDYKFIMPKRDVTVKTEYEKVAVVTKAPEANTLTYNGKAQKLVTAGTATGGEMQYALGTATEATQPYTTSIPTATEAGTYYIWYKAFGNEGYADSVVGKIRVVIVGGEETCTKEPTIEKITNNSITVNKLEGYLYKIGDGEWLASDFNGVFDNLTANTEYIIKMKKIEADDSTASRVSVSTKKADEPATNIENRHFEELGTGYIRTESRMDEDAVKGFAVNLNTELAKVIASDELVGVENASDRLLIFFKAENKDETVDDDDKALLEKAAGELKNTQIGKILDLSFWKQINNSDPRQMTDIGQKVRIKLEIPEGMRVKSQSEIMESTADNRQFYIARIHGDKCEILETETDGNSILFESDKFSTYAILYSDVKTTEQEENSKDLGSKYFVVKSKTYITSFFSKYGEKGYKYKFKVEDREQRRIAFVNKKGRLKAKRVGTVTVALLRKTRGGRWSKIEEHTFKTEKPDIPKKVTTLKVGDKVNIASFIKNNDKMINKPTSYVSSKPEVASIDSAGNITVKKRGSTRIKIIYDSGKGVAVYKVRLKI